MHLDKYTSVRSNQQRHTEEFYYYSAHIATSARFDTHSFSPILFALSRTFFFFLLASFSSSHLFSLPGSMNFASNSSVFSFSLKPMSCKWTYLWSRTRINTLQTQLIIFFFFANAKNEKFGSGPQQQRTHWKKKIQIKFYNFFFLFCCYSSS